MREEYLYSKNNVLTVPLEDECRGEWSIQSLHQPGKYRKINVQTAGQTSCSALYVSD